MTQVTDRDAVFAQLLRNDVDYERAVFIADHGQKTLAYASALLAFRMREFLTAIVSAFRGAS